MYHVKFMYRLQFMMVGAAWLNYRISLGLNRTTFRTTVQVVAKR